MTGQAAMERVVIAPARRAVGFGRLLRRTFFAAIEHDAFTVAQATAYSAMVALFPALVVIAAFVALLPPWLPLKMQMADFFERLLPSNISPLMDWYFATTHRTSQTAGALLSSGVVSLLGAGNVMATLMEGFRRAHHLPLARGSFWSRRGRALALVPLSMLPMTAASALVVFGHLFTHWLAAEIPAFVRPGFFAASVILRWTIALGTSAGILAVVYHLGTDLSQHVRAQLEPMVREPWVVLKREWTWRASLPGAALATVLWFASTLSFGFYVTRFANYGRVYGSLGAAIALMVWLYIIALTVLIGAEFNAQYARERRGGDAAAPLWKNRRPSVRVE
ncbi:MAG TPA: YihY/virulence factor BrkB family protein [Bryocella sp.]|nr:YihY/virulence factor BrkB family protein [Bryocella sp.]